MKIKYNKVKTTLVKKLLTGDLFENDDSVYMITSTPSEYGLKQCVDLETGELLKISIDKDVIPVEGEVIITRRGTKED